MENRRRRFLLITSVSVMGLFALGDIAFSASGQANQSFPTPPPATDPDPLGEPWLAAPPQAQQAVPEVPPPARISMLSPAKAPAFGRFLIFGCLVVGGALILRRLLGSENPPWQHESWPEDWVVLAETQVAGRKSVHLIQVGERILVIGAAGKQTVLLDTISDPDEIKRLRSQMGGAARHQPVGPSADGRAAEPKKTPAPAAVAFQRAFAWSSKAWAGFMTKFSAATATTLTAEALEETSMAGAALPVPDASGKRASSSQRARALNEANQARKKNMLLRMRELV